MRIGSGENLRVGVNTTVMLREVVDNKSTRRENHCYGELTTLNMPIGNTVLKEFGSFGTDHL